MTSFNHNVLFRGPMSNTLWVREPIEFQGRGNTIYPTILSNLSASTLVFPSLTAVRVTD